jgi:hypothetical protein
MRAFLFLLSCLAVVHSITVEKKVVHIAGPMRGSFAVYCGVPPGVLRKRQLLSEKTIVAGPPMRGSFVFYGCCPGNKLGIASKVHLIWVIE